MTNEDKEALRIATLGVLAARHPAALSARQIRNRVEKEIDFPFTDDDLAGALAMLDGMKLTEQTIDDLGTTQYHRATPAGVLHVERS